MTFLALAFPLSDAAHFVCGAASLPRLDHLSPAPSWRAGFDQTMSSAATDLAPVRPPLSWRALAWKATLILIPLLTAAGLVFLRQVEVARWQSDFA
jgi:hypothetical protein